MSLMISKELLHLIGTFDYYVHIPPMLEKTPKRNEKHESLFSCAHAVQRLDNWFYVSLLGLNVVVNYLHIWGTLIRSNEGGFS